MLKITTVESLLTSFSYQRFVHLIIILFKDFYMPTTDALQIKEVYVRIGPISQHFKTRKEISSKSNCIRSPSAPPSLSCLIIAKEKSRSGCQKTFDISHRAPVLSSPHKLQTRNCILGPVETGGVQVSQYLVKLGSLPKLQQSKKNLRKIDGQNSLGLHFPPC